MDDIVTTVAAWKVHLGMRAVPQCLHDNDSCAVLFMQKFTLGSFFFVWLCRAAL